MRAHIPAGLELDCHHEQAYLGVVPFAMDIRPRWAPAASHFLELNVRTYVTLDGKPGVWFFSLDAASALAVWAARRFFHLPYFRARMSLGERDGWVHYRSARSDQRGANAEFVARYRAVAAAVEPLPGSLEHWLVERYCLYAERPDGSLERTEIHHPPQQIAPAVLEVSENSLLAPLALADSAASPAPLVHFSAHQEVVNWLPAKLKAGASRG